MKPPIEFRPKARVAQRKERRVPNPRAAGSNPAPSAKPKLDRKTYLKLAARDRRKRERAEADKLGITVKEYRQKKSGRMTDAPAAG